MNIIEEFKEKHRLFEVLYDMMSDEIKKDPLYDKLSEYLEIYLYENKIDVSGASKIYLDFIANYAEDCKKFIETQSYPYRINELDRTSYDIVLILSTLFSSHRFRIMQIIDQQKNDGSKLIIGVGSGLEIYLLDSMKKSIVAYDLSFNPNIIKLFPSTEIHSKLFTSREKGTYSNIYLIEILEHLENPYDLVKDAYTVLEQGGVLHVTTATNLPQFDHIINFPLNHDVFKKEFFQLKMDCIFEERIIHQNISLGMESYNHFFIFKKK